MDDEERLAQNVPSQSLRDVTDRRKVGEEPWSSLIGAATSMLWPLHRRARRSMGLMNSHSAGTPASRDAERRHALHRLQLCSGVVLWLYVSIHLVNHALGIWSLDIAERGLALTITLWHSLPGTILLYGAAGLHFALALRTIYNRRHWGLPPTEWLRLWAGLSLPVLLIRHAVGTRVAASLYGFEPNYEQVIVSLLVSGTQGLQVALLAPGWVHGCLGLWLHLRRYAPLRRAKLALLAMLLLLPVLSATGFVQMARAIEPGNTVHAPALIEHRAALDNWRRFLLTGYLSLIATAFAASLLRNRIFKRGSLEASSELGRADQ
jgi:adenylate cyclase